MDSLSFPHLIEILDRLKQEYDIDLSGYRKSSLERRISRRLQQSNIKTGREYMQVLEKDPREFNRLIDTVFINFTCFFRDTTAYDIIEKKVLPELIRSKKKKSSGKIRVWCPGCSTGEEVYSIGMLLDKEMREQDFYPEVIIYGTDIDEEAVTEARRARYFYNKLENVSEKRLSEYFFHDLRKKEFWIKTDIRRMAKFGIHNVATDAPISHVDLLVCRNVLIYFTKDLQKKVFSKLHFALEKGGYLVLGKAETPSREYKDRFEPVSEKWKIFKKK